LGFDRHTICSRHNIGGKECNCKFRNLFVSLWCVIKFEHLLMHLHFTYNPYQLWGFGTNGIWILLARWIWHIDITNMFWLLLNISPSGWSWFCCWIIVVKGQHMHFWTRYLVGLGLQPKFSLTKVHNFVGNSKNCVKKHWLIITQFHETILRQTI
jgi:hypothetical protein